MIFHFDGTPLNGFAGNLSRQVRVPRVSPVHPALFRAVHRLPDAGPGAACPLPPPPVYADPGIRSRPDGGAGLAGSCTGTGPFRPGLCATHGARSTDGVCAPTGPCPAPASAVVSSAVCWAFRVTGAWNANALDIDVGQGYLAGDLLLASIPLDVELSAGWSARRAASHAEKLSLTAAPKCRSPWGSVIHGQSGLAGPPPISCSRGGWWLARAYTPVVDDFGNVYEASDAVAGSSMDRPAAGSSYAFGRHAAITMDLVVWRPGSASTSTAPASRCRTLRRQRPDPRTPVRRLPTSASPSSSRHTCLAQPGPPTKRSREAPQTGSVSSASLAQVAQQRDALRRPESGSRMARTRPLFAQRQRSHVRPDPRSRPAFRPCCRASPALAPPRWQLAVSRPDRVLLALVNLTTSDRVCVVPCHEN